jgi:hypothetical protein
LASASGRASASKAARTWVGPMISVTGLTKTGQAHNLITLVGSKQRASTVTVVGQ